MFDEISEIRKSRKKYNQMMFRSGISTFRKFEDLEADALKDGALYGNIKSLLLWASASRKSVMAELNSMSAVLLTLEPAEKKSWKQRLSLWP